MEIINADHFGTSCILAGCNQSGLGGDGINPEAKRDAHAEGTSPAFVLLNQSIVVRRATQTKVFILRSK